MKLNDRVNICTYGLTRPGIIVGVSDFFEVKSEDFRYPLKFYKHKNAKDQYQNVGNAAYWIEPIL